MGELLNRLSLYAAVNLAVQEGGRDVLERVAAVIPAYRFDLRRSEADGDRDTALSADGGLGTSRRRPVDDTDSARRVAAAGWADDAVTAGEAGSEDFPTTTVFYSAAADEAAAAGLAEVIGGAAIEQSDAYPSTSPDTPQLTVVVGLDRTAAGQTPAPTP